MAILAEFERNLLLVRCAAGVKIARQRNVRFGRPRELTEGLIRQVLLSHEDANTTVRPAGCHPTRQGFSWPRMQKRKVKTA